MYICNIDLALFIFYHLIIKNNIVMAMAKHSKPRISWALIIVLAIIAIFLGILLI